MRVATERALTWAGTVNPATALASPGMRSWSSAPMWGAAAAGLIDLLLAAGGELVTVLVGVNADAAVAARLDEHVHHRHPGIELVAYRTGHHGDALLIGVE